MNRIAEKLCQSFGKKKGRDFSENLDKDLFKQAIILLQGMADFLANICM